MTTLAPSRLQVDEPVSWWPSALAPERLADLTAPTPFLVCDLDEIGRRYRALVEALDPVSVFYAMKSNSSPEILGYLAGAGCSFEIASVGELDSLRSVGVDPANVLYSNPVKSAASVERAHALGLWRFSADGESEIRKIARYAPGSAVYLRLTVDDHSSAFPLSRKFGTDAETATRLLLLARDLGLVPYGVTFHVGSQCDTATAWRSAIATAADVMTSLASAGVRLTMLDLGGGIPARYGPAVPGLPQIVPTITKAMDDLLPYRPGLLAIEPGRHLVAESAVMVAEVIGRERRGGQDWIYLDVGAYNGMMETQQTAGRWAFPVWSSRADHAAAPRVAFTVTGPSCDASDTMFYDLPLPRDIEPGDRLYIGSAGAYTTSYASAFNGFQLPGTLFVGGV